MNRLQEYFENGDHRIIDKWIHYFDVYERHLSKYRNTNVTILEIGISHGGSLQMWNDYFGKGSQIYGVDVNPLCKEFEEENIKIFIGSQSDREFLKSIKDKIPLVDIIIDDGGHMMNQQIISFEELYGHLKDDGVYICEDLHTSYWLSHGGGFNRRGTFIEFSKGLIDSLHGWHSRQRNFSIDKYSESISGLHYYDSILVIEKGRISKPFSIRIGSPGFAEEVEEKVAETVLTRFWNYIDSFSAKLRIARRF